MALRTAVTCGELKMLAFAKNTFSDAKDARSLAIIA
jgi:hypothetical protein